MATITRGKTFNSGDTVYPADMHQLVDSATVTGIVNADIDAAAAIAASKLALTGAITDTQLATGAVTGAAGGGKLAASVITGQTTIADALADADLFLVHDDSAAALRKVAWSAIKTPSGSVVQTQYAQIVGPQSYTSGQTLALGTTAPTITSGVEVLKIENVQTSSASNYLVIDASILFTSGGGSNDEGVLMLFAGSTLIASITRGPSNSGLTRLLYKHSPASTSAVTYSVRAANESGTLYVNRLWATNNYNTGKQTSSLLIQEIKA